TSSPGVSLSTWGPWPPLEGQADQVSRRTTSVGKIPLALFQLYTAGAVGDQIGNFGPTAGSSSTRQQAKST
ncbi:MAG TPA: hypothetical protein VE222_09860, partial [Nitrospiraceae bacterium]|nr:hypothetical protein [Nitrospiraceae bacterium]